jgi:hypothetical protein
MSNDFRYEIQLENLFLKHLKIVQQDFDLAEEVQEQIAEARAVKELDAKEDFTSYSIQKYEEDFYSYFIQKYNVDTKKEIEENDR